ncbi:hypothetical protein [Bdellovibrio sp. KM01]|uniref:hypothetical protein n=1 Tax=Bdellovibrio sp. KM01 TaxID=2748865 RepID=UPI0015EA6973|nr:hypothetical protein [Bdellovibrio sp. KM01]QLY26117.1 hypothetical protein HW988_03530 [Bdellovibrio sp. KM01]
MNQPFVLFILSALVIVSGCTKTPGYHREEYKTIKFEDVPPDLKIPTKAWDMLSFKAVESAHGEHAAAGGEGGHGGGEGEGKKESGSKEIVFADVSVFLVDKNPGILKDEALKFELPRGGGEIDLSQYLNNRQGSFYVGFEFPSFTEAKQSKVLFVSHARKRKLGDSVYGAGCNQILDITTKFNLAMQGEGLKVNTTRERHISVLGGTFLFSAEKGDTIYVAQVSFVDPEHANLFCEAP